MFHGYLPYLQQLQHQLRELEINHRTARQHVSVVHSLTPRRMKGLLCSEWMRIVNWYDTRSTTVHGRSLGHSEGIADTAQYWITTRLYQRIILWLADHPNDPIGDRDFDAPCPYDSHRWDERDDI